MFVQHHISLGKWHIEYFMRNLGKLLKTSNVINKELENRAEKLSSSHRAKPHTMTGFWTAQLLSMVYYTRLDFPTQPQLQN